MESYEQFISDLNDSDPKVRAAAVINATDPVMLAKIALNDYDNSIREIAIMKVNDPEVLFQSAMSEYDDSVGLTAVFKISDPEMLKRLAIEASLSSVRNEAWQGLEEPDEALIRTVALHDESAENRASAIRSLTQDPETLKRIAMKDEETYENRELAIRYISDETALEEILSAKFSCGERWIDADLLGYDEYGRPRKGYADQLPFVVLRKIDDPIRLARIMRTHRDPEVRDYAEKVLTERGYQPWSAKLHPKEKKTKTRFRPRGSYPED